MNQCLPSYQHYISLPGGIRLGVAFMPFVSLIVTQLLIRRARYAGCMRVISVMFVPVSVCLGLDREKLNLSYLCTVSLGTCLEFLPAT